MDSFSRGCIHTHDSVTYLLPADSWHNGFPLGNGVLGAMVWGNGDPLYITLDSAGLWDLRVNDAFSRHPDYNYRGLRRLVEEKRFAEAKEIFEDRERRDNFPGPTKISLGRAELKLGSPIKYACSFDLTRAVVEGRIQTASAAHAITCFVHHGLPLLCLRAGNLPPGAGLNFKPLLSFVEAFKALNHPAAESRSDGILRILNQSVPEGPYYSVVWNAEGPDFFLAVELADSAENAERTARDSWNNASKAGFDSLRREHENAWKKFWSVSAVYLPEDRIEYFWRLGIYLLASSARKGARPPGLQGLWAMDGAMPPWRGDYHSDMNVQMTFWPAAPAGHIELLDVWCDYMKDCIPAAQSFTRDFFGAEGTFWPCATLPEYTLVPGWYTVEFALSHSAFLGWLVWMRWRYSMDAGWLEDSGYPIVAEIFKFYRDVLEEESDGFLHVPLSSSPEYKDNEGGAWCKDPAIDLGLIRKCCDWVAEMEDALGIAELSESAGIIRSKLAPYPLTEEQELCLWPGRPLDESHRHPSHLMPVHPAMDLTVDSGKNANDIIDSSISRFQTLGEYRWAGHTYAQLISMAAVLGRAGWAYACLESFSAHWARPNGLHINGDILDSGMYAIRHDDHREAPFTMESNCGVSAGICDMLLQGWGNVLRVFPSVPAHWKDIAFRGLAAEGAFRVSAARIGGKTVTVQIEAEAAGKLRFKDPFGTQRVNIEGPSATRENDFWIADLKAGETVSFSVEGADMDWESVIRTVRENPASRLGMR